MSIQGDEPVPQRKVFGVGIHTALGEPTGPARPTSLGAKPDWFSKSPRSYCSSDGMISHLDQLERKPMPERQYAERFAMPAALAMYYAGPAAVSAIGVVFTLNGHMRGLFGLAMPVVCLLSMWQTYLESNVSNEVAKIVCLSWLAGLPIGIAAWAIAQPLVRFFA
jgi:hypothetical protein